MSQHHAAEDINITHNPDGTIEFTSLRKHRADEVITIGEKKYRVKDVINTWILYEVRAREER